MTVSPADPHDIPTHPTQTGTQDCSAAVLALPDDQTVDVKEYAAGIAILIFICALAEPLILPVTRSCALVQPLGRHSPIASSSTPIEPFADFLSIYELLTSAGATSCTGFTDLTVPTARPATGLRVSSAATL